MHTLWIHWIRRKSHSIHKTEEDSVSFQSTTQKYSLNSLCFIISGTFHFNVSRNAVEYEELKSPKKKKNHKKQALL